MTTKGTLAERAIDSLGIGGNYESDMIVRAIENLDDMMLSWENDGVLLGYITTETTANPNDESGIASQNKQAVILNLACQLAPVLRLPLDQRLVSLASAAYKNLIPIAPPSIAANPYMPLGQGNTYGYGNIGNYAEFQQQDDENLTTEQSVDLLVDPQVIYDKRH